MVAIDVVAVVGMGSTSNELGTTEGKMVGFGAPFTPVVNTFLMRKQAMLNSFLSSLPSLFRSDKFHIWPSTLVARPDLRKKPLA